MATSTSQHHSTYAPLISGSIVGGLVVMISVLAALVCVHRRSRKRKAQRTMLSNEVEEATVQEMEGHVLPYTLAHAIPMTPPLYIGRMSKIEKQLEKPTGAGHQLRRDSQSIPPENSATTLSDIRQAPFNQSNITPATPPELQNSESRESRNDLLLHITAQVAAVQHQLWQIQIQNGMGYLARSPSEEAPPSYIPPPIAQSENSEDEGKRKSTPNRDSKFNE